MESPNSALAIPGPVLTPAQQNQENMNKLEQAVTELLVSSYDPVVGKTIWQCAQCHFSSKVRYTVKQHIETHLAGFTHQCPSCEKTCKTRNALRAHVMRAHTDRPPSSNQNQNWQQMQRGEPMHSNQTSPVMSPDGFMQVQFHEMGEPIMKKPRRPRQARPHDEELERQIRMLLVSNFDEEECKTTWSCAQCNYSNKLQYTVKQHIETHITSIVHQCTQCDKILKTRNALRAHMIQKHEPRPMMQSPQWMGGNTQSNYSSPSHSPVPQSPMGGGGGGGGGGMQFQPQQQQQQYRPRKKRAEVIRKVPTEMDLELDRQVAELMVSNYDASIGKTSWQCAQCHFTSKIRSTVKEHIETHITGFVHQCPYCEKTCKTRNALRVHTVRAHNKHHLENQARTNPMVNSAPKICYEPQPQQQNNSHNSQQQNSGQQQNSHPGGHQSNPQQQQQQSMQQQQQPVVAKRTVQTPEPPKPVMYQPEPPKQPEVPRQGIMNHPMIGRPMYGHPMMMGHPMI